MTQKPSISEYYKNLRSNSKSRDDRTTFWRSRDIADLRRMAPDSNQYLKNFPFQSSSANSKYNLLDLARQFRMHPLLLPCWTCLLGQAVSDYGFETTRTTLRDDNINTMNVLEQYRRRWGADLPPSMSRLVGQCSPGKKVHARP